MIIAREHLIHAEKLEQQQIQVFQDSCDEGLLATPEMRIEIRQLCKELLRELGSENAVLETFPRFKRMRFFVPIEMDGAREMGSWITICEHDSAGMRLMQHRKCCFFTVTVLRRDREAFKSLPIS